MSGSSPETAHDRGLRPWGRQCWPPPRWSSCSPPGRPRSDPTGCSAARPRPRKPRAYAARRSTPELLPAEAEEEEEDDEGGGSAALIGLEIAILLAIVYLLVLVVRWVRLDATPERWRKRRRRRRVEFEVLPATPEQAAEAMVRDADQQLALLRRGQPAQRDRGLLAPVRGAGRGGRLRARAPGRRPPSSRSGCLDVVSADERAVAELSVLYREARFSDHELAEAGPYGGGPRAGADPSQPRRAPRTGDVVTGGRWWFRLVVLVAADDRHAVGG